MTYEIILHYSVKEGVDVDLDCDDEVLFNTLHDDEIFQDLIGQLSARFREMAADYDKD